MPRAKKSRGGGVAAAGKALKKASKVVPKIRGRGDYEIGRNIGSKLGGWVGDMAQKAIMSITGMGDYSVKMNSIVNASGPPVFGQNGRHDIVVCHREFVSLVSSVGNVFNVNSFAVNPTTATFPWLASIAAQFELYKFLGLVFEFKATSATAVSSTNTALGSVILATRYNALTPQFSSQLQMEAYEFSTSTVAFTSAIHPVECAPMENALAELYTDTGFASGDPRFSQLGIFDVATVGQQAASVVGELWVSYHVQLIRPRLLGLISSVGFTSRYSASSTTTLAVTDLFRDLAQASLSNTDDFTNDVAGVLTNKPSSLSLELVFGSVGTNGVPNVVTFPKGLSGTFVWQFFLNSPSAVSVNYPSVTTQNGVVQNPVNSLNGSTTITLIPNNGTTGVSIMMMSGAITVSQQPSGGLPTMTFSSAGVIVPVAEPIVSAFWIYQINS